jgi:hypothetical protein
VEEKMTIDRDEITTAALKLVPGKAWVLKLTELEAAFTPEITAGRPALEFLNGILAASGGPQGRLEGRHVLFSWPSPSATLPVPG